MNIQKMSAFNVATVPVVPLTNPITKKTGLQKDTFERSNIKFTAKQFNKNDFMSEMQTLKDKKGKSQYSMKEINKLSDILQREPKKYEAIDYLAKKPYMKGKDLTKMAGIVAEKLNTIKEFSDEVKNDGKYKYESSHLLKFSELTPKALNNIKPLVKTSLKPQNIVDLANEETIDLKKVAEKVIAMEKTCGALTLKDIEFKKDCYEPDNAYVIQANNLTNTQKSELLDKDMNCLAIDQRSSYISQNNKEYNIIKTNDFRNNTISKVRMEFDENGFPNVTHEVRIVKDKNGNVQKTEYMQPSEIKGVYDVKYIYPNGKEEQISSGKIDKKTGITSVKRDMKSLDGTRTQYLYEDDPKGNRIIDYKITDEKGKELLKYSQSLEVINDNKFISSKNNKSYEMTFVNNSLSIKDQQTGEENLIQLDKFLRGNKTSMINLLKKFPGEELIALKDTTKILKGAAKMDDCCYWPDKKQIDIVDDLYSVLHELGHSKDFNNGHHMLTGLPEVQEVFNKEKASFNKAFPNAQREHINYFIDVNEHYSGRLGGLEETVAESNALLNSYNSEKDIASRAQYLQQYFPKTIAKLSENLYK